jgi:hypothetical protein
MMVAVVTLALALAGSVIGSPASTSVSKRQDVDGKHSRIQGCC